MKVLFTVLLIINGMLNLVFAQDKIASTIVFGNQEQPGTRVVTVINSLMFEGNTLEASSQTVLDESLSESSVILSPAAIQAASADIATTLTFLRNMVTTNSLFDATKATIESTPENIISIINVSVAMYPDFAQDVINAAVMSGEMDSNEALIAAISAGADPTTVGEATAAGGSVTPPLAPPVGVGIGAGGAGGGDATVSTN